MAAPFRRQKCRISWNLPTMRPCATSNAVPFAATAQRGRPMPTILAVDKDPLQLDLLSHLPMGQGYKVHSAAEPGQALVLLQSQLIDLVILETVMARHD